MIQQIRQGHFEILLALEQVHIIFKDLFGWGHEPDAKQGFKPDKNNFEEIVFEQIRDEKAAYINEDPNDKKMHWDSKLWKHVGNSYSNTTNIKEGRISVRISFGSTKNGIGIFNIEFPSNR